jgi:hypothetical protein
MPDLKKFHQGDQKIFFVTFDGKVTLVCRIISSHASDGIFRHQKRKIPTYFDNPDGIFYSVRRTKNLEVYSRRRIT